MLFKETMLFMSDNNKTDLKGTQCTKCNHKTQRYGESKCYENTSSVSSASVSSDGDP